MSLSYVSPFLTYLLGNLSHTLLISKGYHGAAVGKGRQLAKTELEKLKFTELTTREAVFEVARIMYLVHDDAKDKDFELEMSWIGKESNNKVASVPAELQKEAEDKAKAALDFE